MNSPKIIRVKADETPSLKLGEMLLDTENNILYVGVGTIGCQPDEDKEA